MLVRRERAADVPAVDALHRSAFGRAAEADLLAALRADAGWLAHLSLVAEDAGAVAGHVCCTRGGVGAAPALGLGPVAVLPDRQGRGWGAALVHAVVAAAEATGERVVCLLGDPRLYGRMGFVAGTALGIAPPAAAWGAHFQVRVLGDGPPPAGTFAYAAPFAALPA